MAGKVENGRPLTASVVHSNEVQFTQLPKELIVKILSLLSRQDLANCNLVSREWAQELSTNHELWRNLFQRDLPNFSFGGIENLQAAYHQNVRPYRNLIQGSFCCDTLVGHQSGQVSALRFVGEDLCSVASWDLIERLKIWNVKSKECKESFVSRSSYGSSIAETGGIFFLGSAKTTLPCGEIQVIDRPSGKWLESLQGHTAEVLALEIAEIISETGEKKEVLISGSEDATIRIWDLQSMQCLSTLKGHTSGIKAIAIINNRLFSGSRDCTIRVWDLISFKQVAILQGKEQINSLAFDNGHLFSASADYSIHIWDIHSLQQIGVLKGHLGVVSSVVIAYHTLFSCSTDHTIKIWDIDKLHCLVTLFDPVNFFTTLAVKDWKIYSDTTTSGSIKVWDFTASQNAVLRQIAHDFKSGHKQIIEESERRFACVPEGVREKIYADHCDEHTWKALAPAEKGQLIQNYLKSLDNPKLLKV